MSPNDPFSFQGKMAKAESGRRVLQWKYTSSRRNIEKSTGFFTFSMSERLTKEEKNELVDKAAHYDAPDSFPKRPTQEELASFPVAFSYFRLSNGKAVLCRTRYVGLDYASSRYGNFFSHALVLEKGDWDKPLRYFYSSTFATGLTPDEIALDDVPPALPELTVDAVAFSTKPIASLKTIDVRWFGVLGRMVDGFCSALKSGSNLVFFLDDRFLSKAPALLDLFLSVLPEEVGKKVCFSTYVRNPSYEPLLNDLNGYCFVAFASSSEKERVYSDKFVSVDLSDLTALVKETYEAKNVYARRLSLDFIENVARRYPNPFASESCSIADVSGSRAALKKERESDRDYLVRLGTIDELLRGTPSDLRALGGVWTMLDALARESDVVEEFAKTILSRDVESTRFPRELIREILAFCVGFATSRETRLDDGFQSETIDAICSFWIRSLTKEAKGQSKWRRDSYDEVREVFNLSRRAELKSRSRVPYLRAVFKKAEKTGDAASLWLTFALCADAIANEPSNLMQKDVENLSALFRRLRKSSGWTREFKDVFFDVFATKIETAASYAPLEAIFGASMIDDLISSKFSECPGYWRKGMGVPVSGDALKRTNPLLDDSDDEEEEETPLLALVDARSKRVSKRAPKATRVSTSRTRLPGADALVVWLVQQKRFDELKKDERLFGTFKRKHFKRARKYFGAQNERLAKEWDCLDKKYFRANRTLAVVLCASFGVVATLALIAAFFLFVPCDRRLWKKTPTSPDVGSAQAKSEPGANDSPKEKE